MSYICKNPAMLFHVDMIYLAKQAKRDVEKKLCFEMRTVNTGPRSAVGNVSGYRCVSDCRSRGREFDPCPVPYFRGD